MSLDLRIVGATYKDVRVEYSYYYEGGLAMLLFTQEGEPLSTVSVYLEDSTPSKGCIWVKTWSENEGLLEQLESAKLLKRTGRYARAGFAQAAEAQLLDGAS